MALTHVVDTSVLTRLSVKSVRAVVEPLAHLGKAARVGLSDLEVGFSARNEREWDAIVGSLDVFELIETEGAHVERARQVQRLLAARGKRGRKVPDLLIAAAAEQAGLTVLHYDGDFDLISGVTGQPCEWVVQKGSID
ncbi:MAG: PIN domain nuclease [Actinobacteria bacterium]|nr:PIN domain nuclease [Actinomycetota bacterium]